MKEHTFKEKLAQYITMSAAFLAAHPEKADAQILYTDVIPDLVIQHGFFNLDLNNDGVVDFKLQHFEQHGIGNEATYSAQNFCLNANQQAASFYFNTSNGSFYTYLPIALGVGDTVGTINHFNGQGYSTLNFKAIWHHMTYGSSSYPGYSTVTWTVGNFFGINNYLGLKINANGNTYYGWARLDVNDHEIVLKDYAVNLIPDSSILAGETGTPCTINSITTSPSGILALCDSVTVQLFSSNGLSIQWMKNGEWLSSETDSTITINQVGNYQALVSDSNCAVIVNAVQINSLEISVDDTIPDHCESLTGVIFISVNGGLQPYTYLWSNGNTAQDNYGIPSGFYSVSVSDLSGCTVTDSFYIGNNFVPPAISETHIDSLCGNNSIIDISVSSGTSPYSFQWSNGETTESLSNLPTGNYHLIVTDLHGCTDQDTVSIISFVNPNPLIYLNGGVLTTGSSFVNYQWFLNTQPISGATNQQYLPTQNGNYQVQVTDANGCSGISFVFLIQNISIINISIPSLNFSIEDKKIIFQLSNNPLIGEEIIIYNQLGQKVASTKIENENPVIDLSLAPTGIYFYHIRNKEKYFSGKFFIE